MANDPCKPGELWPEEARAFAERITFELSHILHEQNGVTAIAAMAISCVTLMAANCPDRISFAMSREYFMRVFAQVYEQAIREVGKKEDHQNG